MIMSLLYGKDTSRVLIGSWAVLISRNAYEHNGLLLTTYMRAQNRMC